MEAGTLERDGTQSAADEMRENAGEPVGEMPPQPPQDTSPPIDELRLPGTAQLGFFDAGGKKPGSASLRLTGGKVSLVDGQAFKKGETIVLQIVAVVDSVKLQDKKDSATGMVVSCEQQHTARVSDIRIVEDEA